MLYDSGAPGNTNKCTDRTNVRERKRVCGMGSGPIRRIPVKPGNFGFPREYGKFSEKSELCRFCGACAPEGRNG